MTMTEKLEEAKECYKEAANCYLLISQANIEDYFTSIVSLKCGNLSSLLYKVPLVEIDIARIYTRTAVLLEKSGDLDTAKVVYTGALLIYQKYQGYDEQIIDIMDKISKL